MRSIQAVQPELSMTGQIVSATGPALLGPASLGPASLGVVAEGVG